jgi:hypothetical protein
MMGLTTLNNAQVPKDLTDWCPERLRSVDQKQPRPHCPIGYLAAAVTRVVAYCSRFSAPSVTAPTSSRSTRLLAARSAVRAVENSVHVLCICRTSMRQSREMPRFRASDVEAGRCGHAKAVIRR